MATRLLYRSSRLSGRPFGPRRKAVAPFALALAALLVPSDHALAGTLTKEAGHRTIAAKASEFADGFALPDFLIVAESDSLTAASTRSSGWT